MTAITGSDDDDVGVTRRVMSQLSFGAAIRCDAFEREDLGLSFSVSVALTQLVKVRR